ncbi:MAG: phage holin family protein [Clostridiales bacterium]|nr:phage holin family protein [Clostridiales bacterium]
MSAGILRFAITVAAVPLCGHYMDGVIVGDYMNAVIVGLILALIYTVFRPLMRLILSVINFCTLGLLNVVVDAWLVWTVAGLVENSIVFETVWWAAAVALIINAARMAVDVVGGKR